jgi:AraC-like DNA-binding protein
MITSISPTTWLMPLEQRPEIGFLGIGNFSPGEWTYCLPEHWTLHICNYFGYVTIEGDVYELQPGCALIIPPNKQELWQFVQNSYHTCAHFRFDTISHTPHASVPALVKLGDAFGEINRDMEEAIVFFPDQPLRAEVGLWNILFRLQNAKPFESVPESILHPTVVEARRKIELSLNNTICISDLATSCRISHSQLTRLFRKHYGITISTYIRQRRICQIEHLLRYSTKTIKQIAFETGISDLHQFNKIVRSNLGCSPRDIRRSM